MLLIALSFLGLVALLLLRGGYHSAQIRQDWGFCLGAWSEHAYDGVEFKAAAEGAALKSAYRSAMAARAEGSRAEALRLVEVGLSIIERAAPDWIAMLSEVSLLARMADAVVPIQPIKPWVYRSAGLAWLALVGMILHHLAVTTGERLRLRAYVLRGCWRLVRARARSGTLRVHRSDSDRSWGLLLAVRADVAKVSEETLRAFHAALVSLDARPAGAVRAVTERR